MGSLHEFWSVESVCVLPPVISCSQWPSRVSVICSVQSDATALFGTAPDALLARTSKLPWHLSCVGASASFSGPQRALPISCKHHEGKSDYLVVFRDIEIKATQPGVVALALCPAAPNHAAAPNAASTTCRVEAFPLIVTANPAVTAELISLFDTMKCLVAEQHEEQHRKLEQQGRPWATADEPASCMPGLCSSVSSCAHPLEYDGTVGLCKSSFPANDCAADIELELLRTTWRDNFLPMTMDLQAVLACAPNSISACCHSVVGTDSLQVGTSGSGTFAAALSLGVAMLPLELASKMLVDLLEFFALHGCWCSVSYVLAEAFKNGLLACSGLLAAQQVDELHMQGRLHGPARTAAATAASLVFSLTDASSAGFEDLEPLPEPPSFSARKQHMVVEASDTATAANASQGEMHASSSPSAVGSTAVSSTISSGLGKVIKPFGVFVLSLFAVLPLLCVLLMQMRVTESLPYLDGSCSAVGSSNYMLLTSSNAAVGAQPASWLCGVVLCALLAGVVGGSLGRLLFARH